MDATRSIDDMWWLDCDEPGPDRPPAIATDERRMHVRAYNRWVSLLRGRAYPSVADLRLEEGGFGAYSVLLDFSAGPTDPKIAFLGEALIAECGADDEVRSVAEVPSRSLVSRLTDHYLQIIDNRAPIGFEAEFVSQRGLNTLYRGILMPFSSDDVTIDFIYGVINWKELADRDVADELVLEVDRALHDVNMAGAPPAPWADEPTQVEEPAGSVREMLRNAPPLAEVRLDGIEDEFVLLLARRQTAARLSVVAAMPADARLIEQAARAL